MQTKYQIFISSTFRDLIDERQDTMRSVLDMGHIPAGMEIFPAADVEQFEYIKKIIDECDYYVLIVGGRYGSVDSNGVSYTEKEYLYAVEQDKTVLAFLHENLDEIPLGKADIDAELRSALKAFRSSVAKTRLVQHWSSRDDLKAKVIISLHKAFSEAPAVGWVRASVAASGDLLAEVNELRIEKEKLAAELAEHQAASSPRLAGLADVEEPHSIRVRWRTYSPSSSSFTTREANLVRPWKELFVGLSPSSGTATVLGLRTRLETYLKENRLIDEDASILTSDFDVVVAQFTALGLFRVIKDARVNRLELTPLGERRLLEWSVVKSAEGETAPLA